MKELAIPKELRHTEEINIFSLLEEFPITKTSIPVGIVWMTTDYSFFKHHEDNREFVERQLKKLRKSMEEIGWLPGSYVVIYPDGRVIEGHHRVAVAQETNTPIYYIVIKEIIENHVSLLNRGKESWKLTDHLNTYANRGNMNYILLREFIKRHPEISENNCLRICKNTDQSATGKEVGNGLYKVKNMAVAELWCQQLKKLRKYFLNRKGIPEKPTTKINAAFVRGFLHIAQEKGFSFKRFYSNIEEHFPNGIPRQDGVPGAIDLFTRIYNIK